MAQWIEYFFVTSSISVVDKTQDQSYFLCGILLCALRNIDFPLSNLTKTETQAIAAHEPACPSQKGQKKNLLCQTVLLL